MIQQKVDFWDIIIFHIQAAAVHAFFISAFLHLQKSNREGGNKKTMYCMLRMYIASHHLPRPNNSWFLSLEKSVDDFFYVVENLRSLLPSSKAAKSSVGSLPQLGEHSSMLLRYFLLSSQPDWISKVTSEVFFWPILFQSSALCLVLTYFCYLRHLEI